ncbi:hypothetical protein GPA19_05340 [Azoarcus indigens]|uniref:Uncharacterized protein n=1 Tax=Azoarcus indigens TaxID=29545 RepID=A0A4R6DVH7_9RHOO|nr:hypothetical protein [Azoarcus indigens]NMG64369.1 hypothetical protein [Azoarcus indigens]TDN49177.1 hypothetical protein C7389_11228 [Azoarcus indigens]
MNLRELVAECRSLARDTAEPYLWETRDWVRWLNEAVTEACVRARLIQDSDGSATSIALEPGVSAYRLAPEVIDVLQVRLLGERPRPLVGWDLTETHLVLARAPEIAGDLSLTVIRAPRCAMTRDTDCPEINPRHHPKLLDWALRCAYLKQDADTFDEARALKYEAIFEASFGVRPSADVQRKHRRKSPRVVRMNAF